MASPGLQWGSDKLPAFVPVTKQTNDAIPQKALPVSENFSPMNFRGIENMFLRIPK